MFEGLRARSSNWRAKTQEKIDRWLLRYENSLLLDVFPIFLPIAWTLLLANHGDRIFSVWPACCWAWEEEYPNWPWEWTFDGSSGLAGLFWVALVGSGSLLYGERRLAKIRGQEQKREDAKLPPVPFREEFAKQAARLQWLVTSALKNGSETDELKHSIRILLKHIANLASLYGPRGTASYGAYIMKCIEEAPEGDVLRLVPVVPGEVRRQEYKKFLALDPALSATMDSDEPAGIAAFALGVPVEIRDSEQRVWAMPGAQLVFVSDVHRDLGDVSGIGNCRDVKGLSNKAGRAKNTETEEFEVRKEVVKKFEEEYKEGKLPQHASFVSFPLAIPVEQERRERIGAVIVYSDQPKIMDGLKVRWEVYGMVMSPYMDGIAVLLAVLLDEENRTSSA